MKKTIGALIFTATLACSFIPSTLARSGKTWEEAYFMCSDSKEIVVGCYLGYQPCDMTFPCNNNTNMN